jgi:hypothetical protein
MKFEWDKQKSVRNERKHKITFGEAVSIFRDLLSITYPDTDHSNEEDRFLIIGMSDSGSILVVSHTFRNDTIRIISARKATTKERSFYEYQARH